MEIGRRTKINELEQAGCPRSLIFYYEKEGLVTPQRRANRYREYSEADVERLETILALRRLGFSLAQISDLMAGARDFPDAVEENLCQLHQQIETLNGAVMICEKLKGRADYNVCDAAACLREIEREEQQGGCFVDFLQDAMDDANEALAFVGRSAGTGGLALPERGAKRRPLMIYWLVLLGAMLIRLYFAIFPLELARLQDVLAIIAVFVGMGLVGNALLSVCAQFILKKASSARRSVDQHTGVPAVESCFSGGLCFPDAGRVSLKGGEVKCRLPMCAVPAAGCSVPMIMPKAVC